ncbi:MAG: dockerin type I repeat-containing protein [Phycisphaeraceae bacterium]
MTGRLLTVALLAAGLTAPALARTNLLVNPTLDGPPAGDGWGVFGAADFNSFFGANVHISLYADFVGNEGAAFQLGIPGVAGASYTFELLDTRVESSWDADLIVGLEYYGADDTTKLGESVEIVDTSSLAAVDGNFFSVSGTAVPGTSFVRPIVRFDNVNFGYAGQSQANTFVFDTYLSETPGVGGELLRNPGFGGDGGPVGHAWSQFGNTGYNDFFGGNAHLSLFGDFVGNEGFAWQSKIEGEAGTEYRFELADVRIEDNWDADLFFGLEYYDADDGIKLGETIVEADTSITGDGLSFDMTGTAVAGTAFVRPVVYFNNVNFGYAGQSQAAAFVFETSLTEALGFLLGDTNEDGTIDADDIDFLFANLGSAATVFDVAENGGSADSSDVDALVLNVLDTFYGDANLDGMVDLIDLSALASGFDGAAGWAGGDFSGDGLVNLIDLSLLATNFGSARAVPEPAAAVLLGVGALALRRRA